MPSSASAKYNSTALYTIQPQNISYIVFIIHILVQFFYSILIIFHSCVAAVPPFAIAILVPSLETITAYTGILIFTTMFCFPALLAWNSDRLLRSYNEHSNTIYSSVLTHDILIWFVFCTGLVLTIAIFVCLLYFDE